MNPTTRKRVAIGVLAVIFATLLISWCAQPVRGAPANKLGSDSNFIVPTQVRGNDEIRV